MSETDSGSPLFSRPRNPALESTELRVDGFPKDLIDMLDAVSLSAGEKHRGPLVIRIIEAWAQQEAHRWTVIERVMRSNPALRDLAGKRGESVV